MKTIEFDYNSKHYVLGYTRRSVAEMERKGFDFQKMGERQVGALLKLFDGAFLMNHADVSHEVIDEIYDAIDDKSALNEELVNMFTDAVTSLYETKSKNVIKWMAKK